MRTTILERPVRWAESGTWRGVRADLELAFAASTLAVDASAEAALGLSVADASPTPDGER